MAIIRNFSKTQYTVIDNSIFKDKRLSLKARGMLVTLLSLPDSWNFNENGLEEIFCDGLTAIKSSLKQLEITGYLVRKQTRNEQGKFLNNEWIIYEKPLVEKPITGNDTQSNTNISITNKDNIYCPSGDEQNKEDELVSNFDKIWKHYPRKDGKNTAYRHYKAWLKGRSYAGVKEKLTNKEMYYAVKIYAYECDRDKKDKQYIQMGSTFFNETIFEKVKRYKKYPVEWEQKINEWENFKNENL